MMRKAIWKHILISFWAVALSLLSLFTLGFTSLFSFFFGADYMSFSADIIFLFLTVIYTLFLWHMIVSLRFPFFAMVMVMPACLILWILLF
ncbi:MAG: hypothetical protein JSC085_000623 [Candidatus Tokpelaia sp. JSC085]|nr:MAG: hypothetical protein JSC085_000623 [Candidatus Tokpelaia sp. JSC085]